MFPTALLHIGLSLAVCFFAALPGVQVTAAETFRTDDSKDQTLPWYPLKPGEFPPAGSAHYFAGELIGIDHVHRTGTLRVDRTDAQRRSHWDLPVDFQMLPYGAIRYRGGPAELRDIPLGTHLHGLFYVKAPDDPGMRTIFHNRASMEADFNRAILLEDDFSFHTRHQRAWRIDAVDLEAGKLTIRSWEDTETASAPDLKLTGFSPQLAANPLFSQPLSGLRTERTDADAKPITFDLLPSTRIWKANQIGSLNDLAEGQVVQVNLTWATLFGPGRCTDIWLDERSRQLATAQQLAQHQQHQRERGLAGWIDEVDNQQAIVAVTLFGGVDPSLFEDFQPDTAVTAVVAEPSLRSYDQVNDRKSGPLLGVQSVPVQPGGSGVQVRFQPSLLLEGFRPGRIVRLFPSGWPIESIPLEERLFPERD